MSTVAIVCNSSDPSSLYPAFVLGSASAALGDDVVMYFTPAAAPALRPGVLESMEERGMPPMKELVQGILALHYLARYSAEHASELNSIAKQADNGGSRDNR